MGWGFACLCWPWVGHLTNLVLPGEGIFESFFARRGTYLWKLGMDLTADVTAFWASPRFGHPHSQIPSVLGIPGGGCPKR